MTFDRLPQTTNPSWTTGVGTVSTSAPAGTYSPTSTDFIDSFYAVLNLWKSETAFMSDPEEITSHPSFQALVENAETVLPLIFFELRRGPSFLVWVLDDALQDRPYAETDIGDIQAMTKAWIAWGEENVREI